MRPSTDPTAPSPFAWVAIGLIRIYQTAISPLFPASCRFSPTCSTYTLEAIRVHGLLRGSWLGVRRISKCHPLHAGGIDNVPPATKHH